MIFTEKLLKKITFLKDSQELKKPLCFGFFIHCNWGALGAILPFWFEQTRSLEHFVYYYFGLISVASTSFLWTSLITKLVIKKISLILSLLYLVRGLLLLFSNSLLTSVITGICGGVCIIFYSLISRTWVNNWENTDNNKEQSHGINWTSAEFRIASALSFTLIGLGFSLIGMKVISILTLILFTSILPFISHFFIQCSELKIVKKPVVSAMNKTIQCLQVHRNFLIWTLICNFFAGLHIGLITPYFAILLNKIGFSVAITVTLISVGSFLKIVSQPIFRTIYQPHKKRSQILRVGILSALLLGSWGLNFSVGYLIPIVLSTLVIQTTFTFLEHNIYYTIFPKNWSMQLFALGNFLFHISNIAGNFLGNLMLLRWNLYLLIFTGTFMIGIGGLLYHLFIRSSRHTMQHQNFKTLL